MKIIARIYKDLVRLYWRDEPMNIGHTLAVLGGKPRLRLSEDGDMWLISMMQDGIISYAFADFIEKGD